MCRSGYFIIQDPLAKTTRLCPTRPENFISSPMPAETAEGFGSDPGTAMPTFDPSVN